MKEFVTIQSSITITVTSGLGAIDHTRKDSDIPNRLKIEPTWTKKTVMIKKGQGIYPAYIAEWATVKALEKDRILTIGAYCDNADGTNNLKKPEKKPAGKSLEEIAE